jgi:hypothetical protein
MGAPVALHIQLGGQRSFLSLSLGEKGSSTVPSARYGILQRQASQRAAGMIGVRASFLTYPGGQIPVNDEAKFAVRDLIRDYKPEIWRLNDLKQGQIVRALGNPLGLDHSVSMGVVSAVARQIKPDDPMLYIQTDAPITPANSGGPLGWHGMACDGIDTFILKSGEQRHRFRDTRQHRA